MSLIAKSTVKEVNDRLDAVAVVGDYISLEKKSGRFWGRCPFHAGGREKTPSFKVDPDLKMYHCFGCGKGGSIIGFVMEMEKISFPEAVKNLARKMNIEIAYEQGRMEGELEFGIREELYDLYGRTATTFSFFLKNTAQGQNALNYLKERGISENTIDEFRIGYSPNDRNFLFGFLKQKGYSDEFLSKSGLFSSNYRTIPLFSGRIMFPITDRQGRIVAFGGRAMPGDKQNDGKEPPKYINSPETQIYKKAQTLFALDRAREAMRHSKTVYLAEGYIDVIAIHSAGVSNAVAPLGTSFTGEQAALLRRWADRVILVFDNDEAGKNAAKKAVITCRKNALLCSLVNLAQGVKSETNDENAHKFKDPADILQNFGALVLKNVLKFTINDFDYLLSITASEIGSQGGIKGVAEILFPFFDALDSEIELNDYITQTADALKVERSAVQSDYLAWKAKDSASRRQEKQEAFSEKNKYALQKDSELVLLTFIAVNMSLYRDFREALEIKEISNPGAKELFIALEECYKHGETEFHDLLSRIENEQLTNFLSANCLSSEYKADALKDPHRYMEDGINGIKKKRILNRLTEIGSRIRQIERKDDSIESGEIEELLSEKKELDARLRKLKGR